MVRRSLFFGGIPFLLLFEIPPQYERSPSFMMNDPPPSSVDLFVPNSVGFHPVLLRLLSYLQVGELALCTSPGANLIRSTGDELERIGIQTNDRSCKFKKINE